VKHHGGGGGCVLPQTVNPVGILFVSCFCRLSLVAIQDEETVPGIQHPGSTGVIYCSDRAQANGFNYASSHEWSNLGQGAPEVGPIADAPSRPGKVEFDNDALEYAPTTGVKSTRHSTRYLDIFSDVIRQNFEKPSPTFIT
jgi:hypothetical protein